MPVEFRLAEVVLAGCFRDELMERLIGEKAQHADALVERLAKEFGCNPGDAKDHED